MNQQEREGLAFRSGAVVGLLGALTAIIYGWYVPEAPNFKTPTTIRPLPTEESASVVVKTETSSSAVRCLEGYPCGMLPEGVPCENVHLTDVDGVPTLSKVQKLRCHTGLLIDDEIYSISCAKSAKPH